MINVTVKTLDSQSRDFEVPDDYTVRQFKDHIASTVSIPADTQRLIYLGRVLQNDTKLADAGVNGKVLHLVERAPPSSSEAEDTIGQNASVNQARFTESRRHDQGPGAMYLGAMAFPGDFMDSEAGISVPPPRQGFTSSRIAMARVMLRRAQNTIEGLERSNLLRLVPDYASTVFNRTPDGMDVNSSSSDTNTENANSNEQPDSEMQTEELDDPSTDILSRRVHAPDELRSININGNIQVMIGPSGQHITGIIDRSQDSEYVDDSVIDAENDGGIDTETDVTIDTENEGGVDIEGREIVVDENGVIVDIVNDGEVDVENDGGIDIENDGIVDVDNDGGIDIENDAADENNGGVDAETVRRGDTENVHVMQSETDTETVGGISSETITGVNVENEADNTGSNETRNTGNDGTGNTRTNGSRQSAGAQGGTHRRRPRTGRTHNVRPPAMAAVLEIMAQTQRRLWPFLRATHYLLSEDPVLNEESNLTASQAQVIFNGVSEIMHDLSHAYHSLSDIMCDFNSQPQRALRCRPVLVQHSAVLHAGLLPSNRITLRNVGRSGRTESQNSNNQEAPTVTLSSDTNTTSGQTQPQVVTAVPVGDNEIPAIVIEAGPLNVGGQNLSSNIIRGMMNMVNDHIQRQHMQPNGDEQQTQVEGTQTDTQQQQSASLSDNNDSVNIEMGDPDEIVETSTIMPRTQVTCIEISTTVPDQLDNLPFLFGPNGLTRATEPEPMVIVNEPTSQIENNVQTVTVTVSPDASGVSIPTININVGQNDAQRVNTGSDRQPTANADANRPSQNENGSRTMTRIRRYGPHVLFQRQRPRQTQQTCSHQSPILSTSTTSSANATTTSPSYSNATNSLAARIRRLPMPRSYGFDFPSFTRCFDPFLPCNSHHVQPAYNSTTSRNARSRNNTATAASRSTVVTTGCTIRVPSSMIYTGSTNYSTSTTTTSANGEQQRPQGQQPPNGTASNQNIFFNATNNTAGSPASAIEGETRGLMRVVNSLFNSLTSAVDINTPVSTGEIPCSDNQRNPRRNTSVPRRNSTGSVSRNPARTNGTTTVSTTATTSSSSTQRSRRTAACTQTAESVLRERARRLEAEGRTTSASLQTCMENIAVAVAAATVDALHRTTINLDEDVNNSRSSNNNEHAPSEAAEPEQTAANVTEYNVGEGTSNARNNQQIMSQPISLGAPLFNDNLGSYFIDFINTILRDMPFTQIMELHNNDTRRLMLNFRNLFRQYLIINFFPCGFEKCLATEVVNKLFNNHIITFRQFLDSPDIREDIDLVSTICRFNHMNIPDLLSCIMSRESDDQFVVRFPRIVRLYLGQLATLIKSCMVDNDETLKKLISQLVDFSAGDLPNDPNMLTWLRENLPAHMISYETRSVSGLPRFMKDYIVFRLPDAVDLPDLPEDVLSPSPMEVDNLEDLHFDDTLNGVVSDVIENGLVHDENSANQNSDEDKDDGANGDEQLPNLIIEPESWHDSVPADWVPIITRDVQRLRRQGSQPPFSDAYLSGMPSKRRKLLSGTNPEVSDDSVDGIITNTMPDRNTTTEDA